MKRLFSLLPLSPRTPSWQVSFIPVAALFIGFIYLLITRGALEVIDESPVILICTAGLASILALATRSLSRRGMAVGLRRSATQILPALPMLLLIATLATTWMLSGVVPTMVDYGLRLINPTWFLVSACVICGVVSVLTGSSWSTIATIGVAFIGIGSALGYHPGWTAGAIISGAYFGDKVSPLSDTTVIASQTCGVDLFAHIRYMTITTVPAMTIALIVFGIKGFTMDGAPLSRSVEMLSGLRDIFVITPYALIIPAMTLVLIAFRVNTLITLAVSALAGAVATFVLQPQFGIDFATMAGNIFFGYTPHEGSAEVVEFMSTGGIAGILPVVYLVVSALLFGWVMIGSGMLAVLTERFTRRIRTARGSVAATLASGIVLNACTADQYLSIILSGNMYRQLYRRNGLERRLLSRTLEDSVSVTSPIIPWSSCGVTQATVLGVPTLVYLPFCIFNYLTPIVSLLIISTGYRIKMRILQTAR